MAPTFRQLRYFTILAEELHFGRTARRLSISQPPLSASIQQLERDVGAPLLERTSRHVALTPAGRVFADRARRLLADLDESTGLARTIASSPGGVVRVGFVPSMIFRGLPEILATFRRQQPGYTAELRDMNSAGQLALLAEGRLELGFVHQFEAVADVEAMLIATDPFVCCLPADHALARHPGLSLADIGLEPLIMFSRDRAPAYHDHILGLFRTAGTEPLVAHEVVNWLTIVALVGHGVGVAIVPSSLAKIALGRAVFVPLRETWASCDVHCVWKPGEAHDGRDRLLDCVGETVRDRYAGLDGAKA